MRIHKNHACACWPQYFLDLLSQTIGPLSHQTPKICLDTIRQIFALLFFSFFTLLHYFYITCWPSVSPTPGTKGSLLPFRASVSVAAVEPEGAADLVQEVILCLCLLSRWLAHSSSFSGQALAFIPDSSLSLIHHNWSIGKSCQHYPSKYVQNQVPSYHIHAHLLTTCKPASPPASWCGLPDSTPLPPLPPSVCFPRESEHSCTS